MATVEGEGVLQLAAALLASRVTRVCHPAVGLHEHGRAEVFVLVPPVRGAGGRAARAQNALVQTIQTAALLGALAVLLVLRRRASRLQVWLDAAVLLVELSEVGHQVLHNVHVRQRVNVRVGLVAVNAAEARERVHTINVHGAATANALTARATEGQRGVELVLDLDQSIQHHGTRLVQVNLVCLHLGLLRGVVGVL